MTPLVIGLAAVVVVILIAVALGMRHVRNEERADFADVPADRGRADGRPDQDWGNSGQRSARAERPSARGGGPRSRGHEERAGRRGDRDDSGAGGGHDGRFDSGTRAARADIDHDEPDFRTAQRQEARAQARGRQARGRRDDDGDWPSTEWDKLSDADYWKEVASDRPLVTTARVAQQAQDTSQARPGLDRDFAGHATQASRRAAEPPPGRNMPTDVARPPARGVPQPAGAGRGTDFLSAPAVARDQERNRPELARPALSRLEPGRPDLSGPGSRRPDFGSTEPGRPEFGRPEFGRPEQIRPASRYPGPDQRAQRPAVPMPADDDPLTSPSFPKIVTSDSRSYHGDRPAAPAASLADQAGYGAPTVQFDGNGAGGSRRADGHSLNGYDRSITDGTSAATAPRSYQPDAHSVTGNYGTRSHPSPARASETGPGSPAGLPRPAGSPLPAVPPTGNPYGSYVSSDLPGYPDSPTAAYPLGHSGHGYPGPSAGQVNGHGDARYGHGLPVGDSVPPLGSRAASWYPDVPATVAPVPSPGGSAPPGAGLPDGAGRPAHVNGNGQLSPSGYPPGPYASGRHDVPGYPPAGYGGAPQAAYPGPGRHSAAQHDAARYLPPELYGRDGYGGQ
jgi:hypothetical protein